MSSVSSVGSELRGEGTGEFEHDCSQLWNMNVWRTGGLVCENQTAGKHFLTEDQGTILRYEVASGVTGF